jgi:hypothetical protein
MISKLFAAVGAFALAAGLATSASAGITDLSSATGATLRLDGVDQVLATPVPSPNYNNGGPGGAGYSTFADLGSDSIFFQAGSMAAGRGNAASSFVEVSFKVTGESPVEIEKIQSTIFESNFGFYVGSFADFVDPGTGELIDGCSGADLPNCVPTTFTPGFSGFVDPSDPTPPTTLATTTFTFEILQDGATVSALSGSLAVVKSSGGITFETGLGFDDLDDALNGFSLFEVTDRVYAFSWDRTNFTADLLDPIGDGESSIITYRITSASENFATPVGGSGGPSANLIVAFACLADPIGRGGTRGTFFIPDFGPSTCDDYTDSSGETVIPYALKVPVIDGDTLVITAPAIPEPDTWAMLIAGFGLVGLSMRRGKKAVAATSA